ncbi:MAG: hypothetical protein ACJ74H_04985 [Thermoanaerobaculia bacterium]
MAALLLPVQPAAALEVDNDLLALVAMPLAVAAVSEITDVPANDLIDMVTLLNDADVPPVQFVEVVRYVPVALVVEDNTQPRFIEVVREQEQAGVRGTELVTFIENRLHTFGVPATVDLNVTAPRVIEIDDNDIVPKVVRTRIAEVKTHPHGGPPGQLKKAAGVQTGAEIVHNTTRVDDDHREHAAKEHKEKVHKEKEHKVAHAAKAEKHGHGNGKGKGNKGKGKG